MERQIDGRFIADLNTDADIGLYLNQPSPDVMITPMPANHPPSVPSASLSMAHPPLNANLQKARTWAQQHHFNTCGPSNEHLIRDSGVQSMTPETRSIMSGVSSMMQEDFSESVELNEYQQRKFDGIVLPPDIPMSGQTGNSVDEQERLVIFNNAVSDLTVLLRDDDQVVVEKAATTVFSVASSLEREAAFGSIVHSSDMAFALHNVLLTHRKPQIVRSVLATLFRISMKMEGLDRLKEVVQATEGGFILQLLNHLSSHCYYKNALMIIHSLLREREHRELLRRQETGLSSIVALMDREDIPDKLLSVVIDCARYLFTPSTFVKRQFVCLNGPAKLVHILRTKTYENLLNQTLKAMLILTECTENAQAIVAASGVTALTSVLDYPRFVMTALECLRNISDVPSEDDVSPLLLKLLHFLGVPNAKIVLYSAGILQNLCANSKQSRMKNTISAVDFMLQQNGVVSLVRAVQATFSNHHFQKVNPVSREDIEGIQEGALTTLRILCTGHDRAVDVQKAVMAVSGAPELYLHALIILRPAILKPTLGILNKAASQEQNLCLFAGTTVFSGAFRRPIHFIEQITYILQICSHNLHTSQIESVKVTELTWLAMSTLQQLCQDGHLSEQVQLSMKQASVSTLLPVFFLKNRQDNENVHRSALGLLNQLADDSQIAEYLVNDAEILPVLEFFASQPNQQAIATYANTLIQKLTIMRQSEFAEREALYAPDFALLQDYPSYCPVNDDPFATVFYQQSEQQQGGSQQPDAYDSMHVASPASPWTTPAQQSYPSSSTIQHEQPPSPDSTGTVLL